MPLITRKAYWESINAWQADELAELALRRGIRQLPNRDLAIQRAEEAYTGVVNRVMVRTAKEKAEKEAKELDKNTIEEEMLKNGPADALRESISVGVKAELNNRKRESENHSKDVKAQQEDDEDLIESFSSADDVEMAAAKAIGEIVSTRRKPRGIMSASSSSTMAPSLKTKSEKPPESAPGRKYGGRWDPPTGKGKGQISLREWAKRLVTQAAPETWAQRMQKWEAPVARKGQKGGGKPPTGGRRGS